MIEEIHGKISSSGSNLSDRLEDKLTGDFFGTLRYLPFEVGLNPILSATFFEDEDCIEAAEFLELLNQVMGYDYTLNFWVRSEYGEIDATLETEKLFIGLEMKYLSDLSSDDEVDNSSLEEQDREQSINQLSRYSEYLKTVKEGKKKYLLFVAPVSTGVMVMENVHARKLIQKPITLGLLSWQTIYEVMEKIDCSTMEPYQRLIMEDLKKLLMKKGFQSFNGFNELKDYELTTQGYIFAEEENLYSWEGTTIKGDLVYEFK